MRLAVGAAVGLMLAACSSAPPMVNPPPPRPPPPMPTPSAPPPLLAPRPPRDQCGASELQALVGRPRSEIPVPVDPNRQRVACTTCPVTMDFRADRLNFFFDAQTGIIKEIRCG